MTEKAFGHAVLWISRLSTNQRIEIPKSFRKKCCSRLQSKMERFLRRDVSPSIQCSVADEQAACDGSQSEVGAQADKKTSRWTIILFIGSLLLAIFIFACFYFTRESSDAKRKIKEVHSSPANETPIPVNSGPFLLERTLKPALKKKHRSGLAGIIKKKVRFAEDE